MLETYASGAGAQLLLPLSALSCVTLVTLVALCACCKCCTRRLKQEDIDEYYLPTKRKKPGDGAPEGDGDETGGGQLVGVKVRGVSYRNGGSPAVLSKGLRSNGHGSSSSSTQQQQSNPLLGDRASAPSFTPIDPSTPVGVHGGRPASVSLNNRALPSVPPGGGGAGTDDVIVVHPTADDVRRGSGDGLTRDSSASDLYATVDKGIGPPGTVRVNREWSQSVTNRTTQHIYSKMKKGGGKDGDDTAADAEHDSKSGGGYDSAGDPTYSQVKDASPNSGAKPVVGDRHQYEYPNFTPPAHQTPTVHPQPPAGTRGRGGPLTENVYARVGGGGAYEEGVYSVNGSEDPYSSIASEAGAASKQQQHLPASVPPPASMRGGAAVAGDDFGEEPGYAVVSETPAETEERRRRMREGAERDERDRSSLDYLYSKIHRGSSPPPSTTAIDQSASSSHTPPTNQQRPTAVGDTMTSSSRNAASGVVGQQQTPSSSSIGGPAAVRPTTEGDRRASGAAGVAAMPFHGAPGMPAEEEETANGLKREPSYRYITVRESLDTLRDRMQQDQQRRDRQPQQPYSDAGSTGTHDYATIGSDVGYEVVRPASGGNGLPPSGGQQNAYYEEIRPGAGRAGPPVAPSADPRYQSISDPSTQTPSSSTGANVTRVRVADDDDGYDNVIVTSSTKTTDVNSRYGSSAPARGGDVSAQRSGRQDSDVSARQADDVSSRQGDKVIRRQQDDDAGVRRGMDIDERRGGDAGARQGDGIIGRRHGDDVIDHRHGDVVIGHRCGDDVIGRQEGNASNNRPAAGPSSDAWTGRGVRTSSTISSGHHRQPDIVSKQDDVIPQPPISPVPPVRSSDGLYATGQPPPSYDARLGAGASPDRVGATSQDTRDQQRQQSAPGSWSATKDTGAAHPSRDASANSGGGPRAAAGQTSFGDDARATEPPLHTSAHGDDDTAAKGRYSMAHCDDGVVVPRGLETGGLDRGAGNAEMPFGKDIEKPATGDEGVSVGAGDAPTGRQAAVIKGSPAGGRQPLKYGGAPSSLGAGGSSSDERYTTASSGVDTAGIRPSVGGPLHEQTANAGPGTGTESGRGTHYTDEEEQDRYTTASSSEEGRARDPDGRGDATGPGVHHGMAGDGGEMKEPVRQRADEPDNSDTMRSSAATDSINLSSSESEGGVQSPAGALPFGIADDSYEYRGSDQARTPEQQLTKTTPPKRATEGPGGADRGREGDANRPAQQGGPTFIERPTGDGGLKETYRVTPVREPSGLRREEQRRMFEPSPELKDALYPAGAFDGNEVSSTKSATESGDAVGVGDTKPRGGPRIKKLEDRTADESWAGGARIKKPGEGAEGAGKKAESTAKAADGVKTKSTAADGKKATPRGMDRSPSSKDAGASPSSKKTEGGTSTDIEDASIGAPSSASTPRDDDSKRTSRGATAPSVEASSKGAAAPSQTDGGAPQHSHDGGGASSNDATSTDEGDAKRRSHASSQGTTASSGAPAASREGGPSTEERAHPQDSPAAAESGHLAQGAAASGDGGTSAQAKNRAATDDSTGAAPSSAQDKSSASSSTGVTSVGAGGATSTPAAAAATAKAASKAAKQQQQSSLGASYFGGEGSPPTPAKGRQRQTSPAVTKAGATPVPTSYDERAWQGGRAVQRAGGGVTGSEGRRPGQETTTAPVSRPTTITGSGAGGGVGTGFGVGARKRSPPPRPAGNDYVFGQQELYSPSPTGALFSPVGGDTTPICCQPDPRSPTRSDESTAARVHQSPSKDSSHSSGDTTDSKDKPTALAGLASGPTSPTDQLNNPRPISQTIGATTTTHAQKSIPLASHIFDTDVGLLPTTRSASATDDSASKSQRQPPLTSLSQDQRSRPQDQTGRPGDQRDRPSGYAGSKRTLRQEDTTSGVKRTTGPGHAGSATEVERALRHDDTTSGVKRTTGPGHAGSTTDVERALRQDDASSSGVKRAADTHIADASADSKSKRPALKPTSAVSGPAFDTSTVGSGAQKASGKPACCEGTFCYCHSDCDPDTILSENLFEMEKAGYRRGSDESVGAFERVYDSRRSVDAKLYRQL